MIIREHYINQVRPFYESDLVKIITGIRRCGKSVILSQIMDEIREKHENVIFLNFEDKLTTSTIRNSLDLINYVKERRGPGKLYLFLDEVQELDGWQDACKTLRLYDMSVFITGSNSKLLSGEFTKELSGRFVSFRVRPFVYLELLEYASQLGKEVSVSDYIIWGGFPGRLEMPDETALRRYLTDLDNTIVINDLIRRYRIKKTSLFVALVNYVLRSNSRIFSVKSIHDYIKGEHDSCSVNTVMKYLSYLEEAYIIESIKQYSAKTKRELSFYVKIYNEDVSFNSIRCERNRYDLTHNFENIVFNELLYRDCKLQVFNKNGREIDFLCEKAGKKYYIQVAYSVADDKTYEREFSAFNQLDQIDRKIIITNDDVDYSTSNVQHIKMKDFLLSEEL
jgi:predicted AAA+ superfamily ATPase